MARSLHTTVCSTSFGHTRKGIDAHREPLLACVPNEPASFFIPQPPTTFKGLNQMPPRRHCRVLQSAVHPYYHVVGLKLQGLGTARSLHLTCALRRFAPSFRPAGNEDVLQHRCNSGARAVGKTSDNSMSTVDDASRLTTTTTTTMLHNFDSLIAQSVQACRAETMHWCLARMLRMLAKVKNARCGRMAWCRRIVVSCHKFVCAF